MLLTEVAPTLNRSPGRTIHYAGPFRHPTTYEQCPANSKVKGFRQQAFRHSFQTQVANCQAEDGF